ncbi:RidA family protein [Burkholderia sp. Ac-20349]|uniref:RidA family protein n=1 Tax=Burkholderia sp. Ac-20349 TaxID=2703893 RepID=UPI00197B5996|nr:RidA family protein [Burkholderia sp. Ac-20349]
MSDIKRLRTTARMSQAVFANGFAFFSGQVPSTPEASIASQTKEVFDKIDSLLKEQNIGRENIVSATVWLTDPALFEQFNAVWDGWIPTGHAPARACVQAQLMRPGLLVEIAVIASL